MRRKIDSDLLKWKNTSDTERKPLLINGARQVGKTYSVVEFGQKNFDNLVHIDFIAQPNMQPLFEGDIQPERLIGLIEASFGVEIRPGKTLLFFDEIQACPKALVSLKYFREQAPQYHVVAAGSLLGVSLGRAKDSFPVGKVDQLQLYPLDFEEFLWACDNAKLSDLIQECFQTDTQFPLHDKALESYGDYVLIGGMPEAVLRFASGGNLEEVRALQRMLIDGYIADMTKYATPMESARILNVWQAIPEQLAKENHKFQYATIGSSARAHQYEAPINWLNSAGLIHFCYRASDGNRPLEAYIEHDFFKLYLLDCGLLSCLYGLNKGDLLPENDRLAQVRGGLAENYVMQQLVVNGYAPCYWGVSSKAEVDFLVPLDKGNPIPIEVKSGKNVSARSLTSYREKYGPDFIVRMSRKNFGFENGIRSVPLYAAFCL